MAIEGSSQATLSEEARLFLSLAQTIVPNCVLSQSVSTSLIACGREQQKTLISLFHELYQTSLQEYVKGDRNFLELAQNLFSRRWLSSKAVSPLFQWAIDHKKSRLIYLLLETDLVKTILHSSSQETALTMAIKAHDKECAQALLAHGFDPNEANEKKELPLVLLASIRHPAPWVFEMGDLLVQSGADLNRSLEGQHSPLTEAISSNNLPFMKWMLDHKMDLTLPDGTHDTPYASLALVQTHKDEPNHTLEMATLLFEKNPKGINLRIEGEFTPLTLAIHQNKLELVTWLLNHGADPTLPDGTDDTPLVTAMKTTTRPGQPNYSLAMAALLYQKDPSCMNKVVEDEPTPLTMAIFKKRVDLIDWLLEKGADPNLPDGTGMTPLLVAAQIEHKTIQENQALTIVKKLFQRQAQINKKSLYQQENEEEIETTPLITAIKKRNYALAEWLIENGADPSLPDEDEELPLTSLGHIFQPPDEVESCTKLASLLLSRGANINQCIRNRGQTPLTQAIMAHNVPFVIWLLDHGADVRQCNARGVTPLLATRITHNSTLRELLLKQQANEQETNVLAQLKLASLIWTLKGEVQEGSNMVNLEGWHAPLTAATLSQYYIDFRTTNTLLDVPHISQQIETEMEKTLRTIHTGTLRPSGALLDHMQKKQPIFIMKSTKGHVLSILIHSNRFMICDRAEGDTHAIELYDISPECKREELVQKLQKADLDSLEDPSFFEDLQVRSCSFIDQKFQKVGNCPWANAESGFFALLYSLLREHAVDHETSIREAKIYYKRFTAYARVRSLNDYLDTCGKEFPPNREVLQLIREKIDQHPNRFDAQTKARLLARLAEHLEK